MRRITFEWSYGHGDHNTTREIIEFEDDDTDEDIKQAYEEWVWDKIGDQFSWYES